jgi:hypothetical protein
MITGKGAVPKRHGRKGRVTMSSTGLVLWAIAAGYVTAALATSSYQWLMDEAVSFRLLVTGGLAASLAALPLLMLAGPAVIARNSWRGRRIEGRPLGFVALAGVIAAGWSFVTGVMVIEFLLVIRGLVA